MSAVCTLVSSSSKTVIEAMWEASLVKLCFPDPPTPTNSALPLGCFKMRLIRDKWAMASLKNTNLNNMLVFRGGGGGKPKTNRKRKEKERKKQEE